MNNQVLLFNGATLTYDFNGNLTSVTDTSGTATYAWNARNQLTAITAPGLTATFSYDALGRRSLKTINGIAMSFVYDGLNPVQELSGTTPTANLLTGLGIDEVFTRTDSAGTRGVLPDALGSTRALTDNTGVVQTSYTYEPFGNTSVSGTASTNSYQYTGRENDGTGLYYYRARYYSPRLQRFMSEDPIGIHGRDINYYAYVGNDPITYIDPFGFQRFLPNGGRPSFPNRPPSPPRGMNPNRDTPQYQPRLEPGEPLPMGKDLIPQEPWWMRLLKELLEPGGGDFDSVVQPHADTTHPPDAPPPGDGRKSPPPPPREPWKDDPCFASGECS